MTRAKPLTAFRLSVKTASAAAGLLAVVGGGSLVMASTPAGSMRAGGAGVVVDRPDVVQLTAVVRDFQSIGPMSHPDFALSSASTRTGIASAELGMDGKPSLQSRTGFRYGETTATDSSGSPIHPLYVNQERSDQRALLSSGEVVSPVVESMQTFEQWFRDVPGVNRTVSMPFMMFRDDVAGVYVFDSSIDHPYAQRGGYYPIDGQLLGDSRAHNYGFTTEIAAAFVYDGSSPQWVTFSGDDDVFVYIDGRLVIELVNAGENTTQAFDLSRLSGLREGGRYSFKLFHAERRCCASNFRLETTLVLEPDTSPNATISVTGVEMGR